MKLPKLIHYFIGTSLFLPRLALCANAYLQDDTYTNSATPNT